MNYKCNEGKVKSITTHDTLVPVTQVIYSFNILIKNIQLDNIHHLLSSAATIERISMC